MEEKLTELTHIFLAWDPSRGEWLEPRLLDGPPMARVRTLLKGGWTRSSGSLATDLAAAFWNDNNSRKVLVVRLEACTPTKEDSK